MEGLRISVGERRRSRDVLYCGLQSEKRECRDGRESKKERVEGEIQKIQETSSLCLIFGQDWSIG